MHELGDESFRVVQGAQIEQQYLAVAAVGEAQRLRFANAHAIAFDELLAIERQLAVEKAKQEAQQREELARKIAQEPPSLARIQSESELENEEERLAQDDD